jgi:hypothetical protein
MLIEPAVVVQAPVEVGVAIATTGGSVSVKVTANSALAVLPAASVAVNVTTLSPGVNTTLAAIQLSEPAQIPLPPRSFDQVTLASSASSDAVPVTIMDRETVASLPPDAGLLMDMFGACLSE